MSNVKSTDSKQVLDTSHDREILVCSTMDTVTVGALGCSVPSEEKLTKFNTDVKSVAHNYYIQQHACISPRGSKM